MAAPQHQHQHQHQQAHPPAAHAAGAAPYGIGGGNHMLEDQLAIHSFFNVRDGLSLDCQLPGLGYRFVLKPKAKTAEAATTAATPNHGGAGGGARARQLKMKPPPPKPKRGKESEDEEAKETEQDPPPPHHFLVVRQEDCETPCVPGPVPRRCRRKTHLFKRLALASKGVVGFSNLAIRTGRSGTRIYISVVPRGSKASEAAALAATVVDGEEVVAVPAAAAATEAASADWDGVGGGALDLEGALAVLSSLSKAEARLLAALLPCGLTLSVRPGERLPHFAVDTEQQQDRIYLYQDGGRARKRGKEPADGTGRLLVLPAPPPPPPPLLAHAMLPPQMMPGHFHLLMQHFHHGQPAAPQQLHAQPQPPPPQPQQQHHHIVLLHDNDSDDEGAVADQENEPQEEEEEEVEEDDGLWWAEEDTPALVQDWDAASYGFGGKGNEEEGAEPNCSSQATTTATTTAAAGLAPAVQWESPALATGQTLVCVAGLLGLGLEDAARLLLVLGAWPCPAHRASLPRLAMRRLRQGARLGHLAPAMAPWQRLVWAVVHAELLLARRPALQKPDVALLVGCPDGCMAHRPDAAALDVAQQEPPCHVLLTHGAVVRAIPGLLRLYLQTPAEESHPSDPRAVLAQVDPALAASPVARGVTTVLRDEELTKAFGLETCWVAAEMARRGSAALEVLPPHEASSEPRGRQRKKRPTEDEGEGEAAAAGEQGDGSGTQQRKRRGGSLSPTCTPTPPHRSGPPPSRDVEWLQQACAAADRGRGQQSVAASRFLGASAQVSAGSLIHVGSKWGHASLLKFCQAQLKTSLQLLRTPPPQPPPTKTPEPLRESGVEAKGRGQEREERPASAINVDSSGILGVCQLFDVLTLHGLETGWEACLGYMVQNYEAARGAWAVEQRELGMGLRSLRSGGLDEWVISPVALCFIHRRRQELARAPIKLTTDPLSLLVFRNARADAAQLNADPIPGVQAFESLGTTTKPPPPPASTPSCQARVAPRPIYLRLSGPALAGTAWAGSELWARFHFFASYPIAPPRVEFVPPLFHPLVDERGRVAPEALLPALDGDGSSGNHLSTLRNVVARLLACLADPGARFECVVNPDATHALLKDREAAAEAEQEHEEEKEGQGQGLGTGGGGVFAAEARQAHDAGRAEVRKSLQGMWAAHGATMVNAEARALVERALAEGAYLIQALRTMEHHVNQSMLEED